VEPRQREKGMPRCSRSQTTSPARARWPGHGRRPLRETGRLLPPQAARTLISGFRQ
jgi:hypothetical protein